MCIGTMRIGLIGFGSIGRELSARFANDRAFSFYALTRRDIPDAPDNVQMVRTPEAFLEKSPDLVVECAGHEAVHQHAEPILLAGISLIIASIGALADPDLLERLQTAADKTGARIIPPSGAIGGLDLLRAVSSAGVAHVTYQGTKPPAAWKGTPAEANMSLETLREPTVIFTGTGREAALTFPKNANVVAALALAGAGFDTLDVTLVADPKASGNRHAYSVRSDTCSFEMSIQGIPSSGNARTSMTTVLSIEQEIRNFSGTVQRP